MIDSSNLSNEQPQFTSNLNKRHRSGKIWRTIFRVSTVVGVIALVALLLNVVNSTMGYAAVAFKNHPDELAINNIPLENLHQSDLSYILRENVSRRLYENLESEKAFIDRSQEEIYKLVIAHVAQPKVLGTWNLWISLTEREGVFEEAEAKYGEKNPELLDEAIRFMLQGGTIDLTAGMDPASDENHISIASSIMLCVEKSAPLDHITISSDGNGSMPVFDDSGRLVGLTIATQKSLWANFRFLLKQEILGLEESIRLFSTTPADFYKLKQKGEIKPGMDADILLLDKDFNLTASFVMGQKMMDEGKVLVKGTFS